MWKKGIKSRGTGTLSCVEKGYQVKTNRDVILCGKRVSSQDEQGRYLVWKKGIKSRGTGTLFCVEKGYQVKTNRDVILCGKRVSSQEGQGRYLVWKKGIKSRDHIPEIVCILDREPQTRIARGADKYPVKLEGSHHYK